ncbi:MAG: anti-sigma F factor [Clostridia bacterium]|nr:anti-sigma F factor [Clostridia bacterium]
MQLTLPAISRNEAVARAAVAVFCAQAEPDTTELADIKCAVSEAVTNCIVHAYRHTKGSVYITVSLFADRTVRISIADSGCGIANIAQAREPLFTTDAAGERSGMGFTVMENFMDRLYVSSHQGKGTTVVLVKHLGRAIGEE